MKSGVCAMVRRSISAARALAAAALIAATLVHAGEPTYSDAEKRLFMDDHLRGLPASGKTLEYTFAKRGTLEGSVDDTARVVVGPAAAGAGRAVKVEYLSDQRKLELPDIPSASGNPIVLFFLEREVREMHRLTGGSVNYYRKRIRLALAEGADVDTVQVEVGSRKVSATRIRIAPYRDDPARVRYEKFAQTTYVFMLSDDVPGKVVEMRSELLGSKDGAGGAEPVLAETLRYARER